MRKACAVWALAVAACCGVRVVLAEPLPVGAEFQVNTYTTGNQAPPSVTMAADGSFTTVWGSNPQDGSFGGGIFGQRYASDGTPAGTEFQVNSYTVYYQYDPAVAGDANGNFVVVWTTNPVTPFSNEVAAQRFSSAGVPVGTEFQVNSYTTGNQNVGLALVSAGAAMDADGDFVVIWSSGGNQDSSGYGIFGQRYASDGSAVGSEFQVNTYTTGDERFAAVAMDDDGDAVVVWGAPDGTLNGTFGQRLASSGSFAGTEFQVSAYTSGNHLGSSVAMNPTGGFVVTWLLEFPDEGIWARRFDSAGSPIGDEFKVNTHTAGAQWHPSLAVGTSGDFVVAWGRNPMPGGYEVFAQRFFSNGSADGTEFQVNTFTSTNQMNQAVAMRSDFVVVWESTFQDYDNAGVFGQRFTSGTPPLACPATPATGCLAADKAIVKVKADGGNPDKNKVIFKWKGTTTKTQFGDPTMTTGFVLCLFDGAALDSTYEVSGGANWTENTAGFKYKNSLTNPDGLFKVLFKEGAGSGKVLFKGKKSNVTPPGLPFANPNNVTVQVHNGTECWEAVFTNTPAANDTGSFKNKTP